MNANDIANPWHVLWQDFSQVSLLLLGPWVASLLLQFLLAWFMWRQYRWTYGTREWRQGWGWLLASVWVIFLRRSLVIMDIASDVLTPTALAAFDGWAALLNSTCLALGCWRLWRVSHQTLPPVVFPLGHVSITSDSVILTWDSGMARIFGWDPSEAVGQTLMSTIIRPLDWEVHRAGIARFVTRDPLPGVPVRCLAAWARTKDGREIPIEITVTAVKIPTGQWQFHGAVRRLIAV